MTWEEAGTALQVKINMAIMFCDNVEANQKEGYGIRPYSYQLESIHSNTKMKGLLLIGNIEAYFFMPRISFPLLRMLGC